jgi:integrase
MRRARGIWASIQIHAFDGPTRRAEVGHMTWSEIDLKQKIWTLPRERTKADRAHEVPLSDLALSIIQECPKLGEFVFSTGRSAPAKNRRVASA